MNDYVPLASFDNLPSPHVPLPEKPDPWFVWAIAASPLALFALLLAIGSSGGWLPILILFAGLAMISTTCVLLARYDQRAIAELSATHPTAAAVALIPGLYLLVRALRRITEPHRGNPLHPLTLHLALGFVPGYYFALFLMGIASIVNRGGIT